MNMERSKLVDKSVYVKWYNLAKEEINDYDLIPERNQAEIFKIISRENWLLFCSKKLDRDDARQIPEPNIFFDVLAKEGNLTGFGRLGLTFNNLGAYNKFRTIMRGPNKEIKNKITKKLLGLKYNWKIKINRKIKKYNYVQTPEYKQEGEWDTKKINETIIDEIIKKAEQIREEGMVNREKQRELTKNPKKFYSETPAINLMEAEFKLSEEEFRDRVSEIFGVLILCLGVKSDVEVNKIIREKVKKIKELKKELERLNVEIPKQESLKGVFKQITEESIEKNKNRKKQLKEEIEQLETEID